MDPNEILKTLLTLATRTINGDGDATDTMALANAVLDIDNWLRHGGCLPRDWSEAPMLVVPDIRKP